MPKVATLDTKITLSTYLITVLRKLKDLEIQVASVTVQQKIIFGTLDTEIKDLKTKINIINNSVNTIVKAVKHNVIDFDK